MKRLVIAALMLAGCGLTDAKEDGAVLEGTWEGTGLPAIAEGMLATGHLDTFYVSIAEAGARFYHGRVDLGRHGHTSLVYGNYVGNDLLLHYDVFSSNFGSLGCMLQGEVRTDGGEWHWLAHSFCNRYNGELVSNYHDLFFIKETDRWMGVRLRAEQFAAGYSDPETLAADSTVWRQDGAPVCTAFTRTAIDRPNGVADLRKLQVHHIVSPLEAWQSRNYNLPDSTMYALANDSLNVTMVTAKVATERGDKDVGEWVPAFNGRWLAERVLDVKRRYFLSVDEEERARLDLLIQRGTDAIGCS